MKAAIGRAVALLATSRGLRDARRWAARTGRAFRGGRAVVHYFHQSDDPYSHLAAQTLARLATRYRIVLAPHLVPAPGDAAAPDRVRLARWSRRDAGEIAAELGLAFAPALDSPADARLVATANAALAAAIGNGTFTADAPSIGAAFWRGDRAALRTRAAEPAAVDTALRDAKREADRLAVRFGRVADPVGAPTERGLVVLHHAIAEGKGRAFLESFLAGAFAEGIDAGSDAGLRRIASRAGLGGASVAAALADSSWCAVAEANRALLLSLDLWGVPSFRVDDRPARWGQDRLWAVERDLIAAARERVTKPHRRQRHP